MCLCECTRLIPSCNNNNNTAANNAFVLTHTLSLWVRPAVCDPAPCTKRIAIFVHERARQVRRRNIHVFKHCTVMRTPNHVRRIRTP